MSYSDNLRNWVDKIRNPNSAIGQFVSDTLTTLIVVIVVGLTLFAVSGIWPPLVAVESGSMEPNMYKGDLVLIVEEQRLVGEGVQGGTGIVTEVSGESTDYRTFNKYGDVIVYYSNGNNGFVPIIHRASFWVEKGENWYKKADSDHLSADSCSELRECPAPNSGFITLGDNNQFYDQSNRMGVSSPVHPSWIIGKAKLRIPELGWPRLILSG